jgi:hypothetical protein
MGGSPLSTRCSFVAPFVYRNKFCSDFCRGWRKVTKRKRRNEENDKGHKKQGGKGEKKRRCRRTMDGGREGGKEQTKRTAEHKDMNLNKRKEI